MVWMLKEWGKGCSWGGSSVLRRTTAEGDYLKEAERRTGFHGVYEWEAEGSA